MALLPDVVAGREAVPVLVDDAVISVVTKTVLGKPAEGVLMVAVPVDGLVVGVDHLTERQAERDLGGIAVAANAGASVGLREKARRERPEGGRDHLRGRV